MINIYFLRNIFIFLVSLAVIFISTEYTDYANLLPTFCAILIIIFTILDYFQNKEVYKSKKKILINFRPYVILFISFLYVFSILFLGFFVSTILFFIVSSYYLGVKNFKHIFVTLVILIPFMYIFFSLFLKTNLPKGLLI
ncbi:tripartite tricarboxylate transporter TctB family protein [Candidatus Pelagibacter sp. HIMB1695]|uniref:tripartite tricarboxylate transporter TctB family protein n=1 Tax=Candidatus Pelagibacter sp. HIMB1695 TaxID=3413364 RepID=UPI003F85E265